MSTVPVQTRLATSLANVLDARARAVGTTRAEVVRMMLEAALAAPQPVPAASAPDPLLGQIADAMGTLLARSDAILEASRSADARAHAAHATAHLHALMMLPQAQQAAFVDKLARKLS